MQRQRGENDVEHHHFYAKHQHDAALVQVEEHVENRHQPHLQARPHHLHMQQRQVQAGDTQGIQQRRARHEGHQHGQGLDFGDFAQPLLDGIDHFVAH